MFKIENLDHVAIFVEDMAISIKWYEDVLGLKRVLGDVWKKAPAMMFANNTGVAIFPAKAPNLPLPDRNNFRRIDHFAFYIDSKNFKQAQEHYKKLGISYRYQDHIVYESIYTEDPDGHTVELTTLTNK